jgi:hypothetical protein
MPRPRKKAEVSQHSRQHQQYFNAKGVRLPGVTTLVGLIDKPFLAPAANKLGLQGIDSVKHWNELAIIGKCVHEMVFCNLANFKLDLKDYTARQIGQAENGFNKFRQWKKDHTIDPFLLEEPLVSEKYQFGGTMDIYGKIDGRLELIDAKSGSGIWPDMWLQMAGYFLLLEENGFRVDRRRILNIGRDKTEDFAQEVRLGPPKPTEISALRHLRGLWADLASLRKDKD